MGRSGNRHKTRAGADTSRPPDWRLHPTVVPGSGHLDAAVMVVGEGPGDRETAGLWDAQLRRRVPAPFIGPSGDFLTYLLETVARIPGGRPACYITNVVKRQVAGNDTPTPDEIELFRGDLERELEEVRPEVVVAAGAVAARWFLGEDFPGMDLQHGLPMWSGRYGVPVIPCYHPASALHDTDNMPAVFWDYQKAGALVRGEIGLHEPRKAETRVLPAEAILDVPYGPGLVIAIDTEDHLESGLPWCLTVSWEEGSAAFVPYGLPAAPLVLARWLAHPETTCFIHNTLHDLLPLRQMGLDVQRGLDWEHRGDYCRIIDTQVLAFEQGRIHTQALKTLSYRLLGVRMDSYEDIVGPVAQSRAIDYVFDAFNLGLSGHTWSEPEMEMLWDEKTGKPKIGKPWGVKRRLQKLVDDYFKLPEMDMLDRWSNMPDHQQQEVAEVLGRPFPVTDLSHCEPARARHYACQDADMTRRLGLELGGRHRILDLGPISVIDHVQIPMVERMQRNGLPSNHQYFLELGAEMRGLQAEIAEALEVAIGRPVNPNSTDQVAQLLYEELGLTPAKRTRTGKPSTGKKALQHLRDDNPLVDAIMQSREYAKIDDAFCGNIARRTQLVPIGVNSLEPDAQRVEERAFYELMVTRVKTGRLAAKNFNALAIPVRTRLGTRIRAGFRARPGRLLGTWDLSQIEMRVMAHESEDPLMMEVFNRDPRKFAKHERDLHIETAARIWGCRLEDVRKEWRTAAKSTGFGILMGITGKGLVDQMRLYGLPAEEWSEDRCEELRKDWLRVYQGVADYQQYRRAEARRTGQVRDMFGRVWSLPHCKLPLSWIAEEGLRQSHALPIQAGAQAIEKLAMGRIWREVLPLIWEAGGYCEPILQVHDELLFEFDEAWAEVLGEMVLAVLTEAPVPMRVPLEASGAVGESWGDLEK